MNLRRLYRDIAKTFAEWRAFSVQHGAWPVWTMASTLVSWTVFLVIVMWQILRTLQEGAAHFGLYVLFPAFILVLLPHWIFQKRAAAADLRRAQRIRPCANQSYTV